MNVDGWITIGTKIDNSELEKELRNYERELKRFDKDTEKLLKQKAKIEVDLSQIELAKEAIQHETDQELKLAQTTEQVNYVLKEEEDQLKFINAGLETTQEELDTINSKIKNNADSQELVKQKIEEINVKLKQSENYDNIRKSIDDVGKSVEKVIKKVTRWGLAIFGIQSAYFFVRQAMSTLTQYNDQLATDINYIKFAIASTLEPVIVRIVQLIYQLLGIVGTLIKRLTGYNIFKNSGIDKFQKGMKDSANSAKEIKKQLAGFDEMNILQDSSSAGSDEGGGTTPSSKIKEQKLPKWMEDLIAHGNELIAIILGIVGALKLLHLGFEPIVALGIGIAIAGVVYAIISLLDYLKDPTWENFGKTIIGIGIAIAGVAIAFGAWPVAVAGAIVAVIGIIISKWEEIKSFLMEKINWLTEKSDEIRKKFGDFVGDIYDTFVGGIALIVLGFDEMFSGLKQMFDGIIKFISGVFKGDWKKAWEGIVDIFSGIFKTLKGIVDAVLGTIQATIGVVASAVGNIIASIFKRVINAVLGTIESVLNSPIRAINSLIGIINKLPGVNMSKLQTFSLPRLAKGGIINMPSRGVPVGSAIAGERGMEGVIPLTDSQQMSLLGEAIGKYITINAQMNNYMDGRLISRQMEKIQSQRDFVMNGR